MGPGNKYPLSDGSNISDNVLYDPWCVNPECTEFSSSGVTITPSPIQFNYGDRDSCFEEQISIENTGQYDLNDLNLSASSILSKYNVNLTANGSKIVYLDNLSVGNTWDVTVNGCIPEDEESGDFGTLYLESDNVDSSVNLNMASQVMLGIDKLKAYIDGSSDKVNDGEKIGEDALPEDTVRLEIDVINLYDDSVDEDISDIEDIEVTVTVYEIEEDGDDIELEEPQFDLNAEDKQGVDIEFNVPLRVEKKEYEIDIEVKGDDGIGTEHELTWTIYLEVVKEGHEIRIQKAEMVPSELACEGRGKIELSIINTGKNDEDNVLVTAKNSGLDLDFKEDNIDLEAYEQDEEDDIYDFSIPIDAKGVKAGTYSVEIRVYEDEDDYYEREGDFIRMTNVNVVVKACAEEAEEEPEVIVTTPTTTTPAVETPTTGPIETITGAAVEGKPFTETTEYVALLVLANLVVLMVVIALVAKFILVTKK